MANSEAERIVGISLSGGGIRAAAFGLGALQALQAEMQLVQNQDAEKRAKYLSAVSGGSYIAGALTMLKTPYPDYPDHPNPGAAGDPQPDPRRVAFEPGSLEVEFIRRRARYLLGAGGGAIEAVTQFAARLFINLLVVSLVVGMPALLLGWIYARGLPLPKDDVGPVFWLTVLGVGLFTLGAALIVFFVASDGAFLRPDRIARWLLRGGLGLVILGVLPAVISWLTFPSDFRHNGDLRAGSFLGRATAVTVIALVVTTALALKVAFPGSTTRRPLSRFRSMLKKGGHLTIAVLATLSVPFGVVLLSLWAMQQGAQHDEGIPTLYGASVLAAFAVFCIIYFTTPTNWSLHPFYKRRLMSCFCIRPTTAEQTSFEEGDWKFKYKLSASELDTLPELRICAAANISTFGGAPAGQNVLPWVFSPSVIGIENGHGGAETLFKTRKLEAALGDRACRYVTVPAAVAITGAAVSPSMGKFTAAPVRALLAVFNLRLGVWLPNPANEKVRKAVEAGNYNYGLQFWKVFQELLGRNQANDRFVYVSDGGHYENLGLVELLRLNCTEIWCIDASGDSPGGTGTLTEAIRIAEADLGVRWEEAASVELRNLELDNRRTDARVAPTVRRTWVSLGYELASGREGRVWVIKVGISQETPKHLRDYQRQSPAFPYDPTGNQLFRADRFDAYRALGFHSTEQAIKAFRAHAQPAPQNVQRNVAGDLRSGVHQRANGPEAAEAK